VKERFGLSEIDLRNLRSYICENLRENL